MTHLEFACVVSSQIQSNDIKWREVYRLQVTATRANKLRQAEQIDTTLPRLIRHQTIVQDHITRAQHLNKRQLSPMYLECGRLAVNAAACG